MQSSITALMTSIEETHPAWPLIFDIDVLDATGTKLLSQDLPQTALCVCQVSEQLPAENICSQELQAYIAKRNQ